MAGTLQLEKRGQIARSSPQQWKREALSSINFTHDGKREAVSSINFTHDGKREAVASRREEIGVRRRLAADRRRKMRREMEEKEKLREDLFVAPKKIKMDDADLKCRKVLGEFQYLFILSQNKLVPDGFEKENVSFKSEAQRKRKLPQEAVVSENRVSSSSDDDKSQRKSLKSDDKYCDLVGQIMQGRLVANYNDNHLANSNVCSENQQHNKNKRHSPFKHMINMDKESLTDNPFQLVDKFKKETNGKKILTKLSKNYTKENMSIIDTVKRPSIICSIPFEKLKSFQPQLQLHLKPKTRSTFQTQQVQMPKSTLNQFSTASPTVTPTTADQDNLSWISDTPMTNDDDNSMKMDAEPSDSSRNTSGETISEKEIFKKKEVKKICKPIPQIISPINSPAKSKEYQMKKPKVNPTFYTKDQVKGPKSNMTSHTKAKISEIKSRPTFHPKTEMAGLKQQSTFNTEALEDGPKSGASTYITYQITKQNSRVISNTELETNNAKHIQSSGFQGNSNKQNDMHVFQTENQIDKQESKPVFNSHNKIKAKSMPILML